MRLDVNSNRFEISLRGKISLRCKVTYGSSLVRKPIRAIHFLEICDWFVLDIEFVFKIE